MDDETFATALNRLLQTSRLSGNRLADRVGVDPSQVSRWRNGEGVPRPENVRQVAAVLGVDANWLMAIAYPDAEAREAGGEPDMLDAALRQRSDEIREALRDIPRQFWPTIIKTTFDQAIDGARATAAFWAEVNQQPPVSASELPEVSAPDRLLNGDTGAPDAELPRRQHAHRVLASVAA